MTYVLITIDRLPPFNMLINPGNRDTSPRIQEDHSEDDESWIYLWDSNHLTAVSVGRWNAYLTNIPQGKIKPSWTTSIKQPWQRTTMVHNPTTLRPLPLSVPDVPLTRLQMAAVFERLSRRRLSKSFQTVSLPGIRGAYYLADYLSC